MGYEDYDELLTILTFAKTKLDKKSKVHQKVAKRIDELKDKIYEEQANLTCERY